ncbi:hypothetical protein QOZ84_12015 [Romboutsia sedimentorum]|uniref:Uncharacterized protein n=1 Tax=Romboutsia sedimentorum TaxID=1368474 RepID=A0ABT7EDW0_9FIRM|nr:DUF6608 family protein [Romboutsia sedimentorum]MDK2564278.1 hypothetical protein [Romboutsia sedimentorum]
MLSIQSNNYKKINFSFINVYCLLFTVTTIISSLIQLTLFKQVNDTNSHILNRAIVVAIGTSSIYLLLSIKLKNKILEILIPYVISLSIVLLYVFFTGFFEELHPNAYRDITLNYSAVFIIVAFIVKFITRKSKV